MNLAILLSISALAAAQDRIELPVVVKAAESSCDSRQPRDPTIVWKDDHTAIVKATVLLTARGSASDEAPHAYLKGKQLKVCYNLHKSQPNPYGVTEECLFPEDLVFIISNIPRGDYVPRVSMCNSSAPKVLYYKCVKGGKTTFTIYETPNCTPVSSDDD